jgi:hypothetical protein
MLTTKLLVRLLKIAVLLIFPVLITGLAISILSGVICMLSGVNFHTITSSALMIIFGVVSYIMVLIFTGDAIDN